MALAAINGEPLGHTITADRLGEDVRGCVLVALIREGDINGLAALIHSAIERARYGSVTFMDVSSIRQLIDSGQLQRQNAASSSSLSCRTQRLIAA